MNQVETELKERARKAGLNVKDLAIALNQSYSSVAGRLNGFYLLNSEDRQAIMQTIEKAEQNKKEITNRTTNILNERDSK